MICRIDLAMLFFNAEIWLLTKSRLTPQNYTSLCLPYVRLKPLDFQTKKFAEFLKLLRKQRFFLKANRYEKKKRLHVVHIDF